MSAPSDSSDDGDAVDADTADSADSSGLSKRTLVRILVGFALGVPLAVEGATFFELFRRQLTGADEGDGGGGTSTATEAPDSAVDVGDDVLEATDRPETLRSAILREESGDRWPLSLTVEVENTGETDYEFQLLAVHLDDGRSVSGRTSTDRLAPGESRTITAEWSIPAGSTPRAVDAVALIYGDDGVETVERQVELAKIPVRGS